LRVYGILQEQNHDERANEVLAFCFGEKGSNIYLEDPARTYVISAARKRNLAMHSEEIRPRVHFCTEGLEIFHYYERETASVGSALFSVIRQQLCPVSKFRANTTSSDTGVEQILSCKTKAVSAGQQIQYRKVGHRASVDCEDVIEEQRWAYATSLARMVGAPYLAVRFGDADEDVYQVRIQIQTRLSA
jgi:hypothetical protein